MQNSWKCVNLVFYTLQVLLKTIYVLVHLLHFCEKYNAGSNTKQNKKHLATVKLRAIDQFTIQF